MLAKPGQLVAIQPWLEDLGLIPAGIGYAVDGLKPAQAVTMQGTMNYSHIKMHAFSITYGEESLINLPDNSGWTVKIVPSKT